MKNKQKFFSPAETQHLSENNSQNVKRPVVPIGPRFQANLPTFMGSAYKKLDTSSWLGTQVWPVTRTKFSKSMLLNGDEAPEKKLNFIGKGRTDVCACHFPGSSKCINKHIAEEKNKLRIELGPAFGDWKFSTMGEGAFLNWTAKEKQKLESIVEMEYAVKDEGFLKSALKSLPDKNRETIISYYFNIIVPKQISMKIKSGLSPVEINTDDEETERTSSSGHPRKKLKTKSKPVKRGYLTRVR